MVGMTVDKLHQADRRLLEQFVNLLLESGEELSFQDLRIAREILKFSHHSLLKEVESTLASIFGDDISELDIARVLENMLSHNIVAISDIEGQSYLDHVHPQLHHGHFICMRCSKVEEFSTPVVEEVIFEHSVEHGFYPVLSDVDVFGLCQDCFEKKKATTTTLADCIEGQIVEVVSLSIMEEGDRLRLKRLGVKPGEFLRMIFKRMDSERVQVLCRDRRFSLSLSQCTQIKVRLLSPQEQQERLREMRYFSSQYRRLCDLKSGERARIVRISGNCPNKQRLLELGFAPGASVLKIRTAPLKDPAEYLIRGYHVSLRNSEAGSILVEGLKRDADND
jgi:Fe2+ transport system protein FeoA/Fe2+ or Zn2+ uptake regulation protein